MYEIIENELNNMRTYIENITISNYKNCILPEKLAILSNLYFFYEKTPNYIKKLAESETDNNIYKTVIQLIEDITLNISILKLSLLYIEKHYQKTNEKISFKEYINKNRELLEMYIAENILNKRSPDSQFEKLKMAM